MKENIQKANIENLCSLWRTAGVSFEALIESRGFNYCKIQGSDWPNRWWFEQDLSPDALALAAATLPPDFRNLILSYWDIWSSNTCELLEAQGFKVVFEQVGMSLKLNRPFLEHANLNVKLVSEPAEAKLWSEVHCRAFGYRINAEILPKTWQRVSYYLAYDQNQAVGTAVLYHTGKIAGIHGVGVVPEMRRKGIAEKIMKFVLNQAREAGAEHATLQASDKGKGIYEKLGFEADFVMKNYVLA